MLMENLIHHKHSLKILFKSKRFPRRYRRKREWVFFSETQCTNVFLTYYSNISLFYYSLLLIGVI